ncbi:pleckstrin homology domain-containing family O member 2 [Pangasianodon hypophthalmus]|uniref:pleckstrin homology domain-containing family O member 2 n=1 Tax=Pangasianodon hypophthalmus TaxID=310915 RepID=UPI002307BEE9|nr:pleckstrin homology domain-containing family O member 2 [Pangasianodon hypophthalmus]
MGDDVKDEPAKPKETTFKGKAGWLKKSSGKFLGSYKDRYIQLDKTEIAVYENEDLQNCVERLDLENYDKCHELRSPFKKKYRLILIRTPKSASKVSDVKLQAQNQEEKEAWIKALSDGINRAKNKIFDEVKVDESLSLDHVTRSRPKGNRGRRPPTRIHMKEAASISSDGVLRLDLDTVDNMPNGAHFLLDGADGEAKVAPAKSLDDIAEEPAGEDTAPQKKVLKPPMPPSKENKPSESQDSESKHEESAPQKKILMPPMPPSKEQKPSENTEEEKGSEEETVVKPPMPPSKENKPRISASGDASEDTATENGESEAVTTPGKSSPVQGEKDAPEIVHPPSPPSKDMKPKQAISLSDKEILSEDDEGFNSKENEEDEAESGKTEDEPFILSNKVPKPQGVMWDSPSSAVEKSSVDQNANKSAESVVTTVTLEPAKPANELKLTPHSTPEAIKKSAAPPAPPKKKPLKPPVVTENQAVQDDPVVSAVSSSVEKGSDNVPSDETKPATQEPKEERKIVILRLSNSGASEEPDDISGVEAEVKSIDSGQLSAEDSESSEQVTPSTDKLQSSLEVLDGVTSEEELETPDSKVQKMEDPLSAILTVKLEATMDDSIPVAAESTCTPQISSPAASLNSSIKKRSASTGDLLEEMKGLQSKVSMELEETGELLGKIAPRGSPEAGQDSEGVTDPEILLATAMEKLKKADEFLREAKSFKEQENKSNRTSW